MTNTPNYTLGDKVNLADIDDVSDIDTELDSHIDETVDKLNSIESKVDVNTTKLSTIDTNVIANKTILDTVDTNVSNIKTTVESNKTNISNLNSRLTDTRAGYLDRLANSTYGLDKIKSAIDTVDGIVDTINTNAASIKTTVESNKTTLSTVNTNAARLTSARATKIDNIGTTTDTGGSDTTGTVMAKLNGIWTNALAAVNNTKTNNTASKTGVLSAKSSYIISLLENSTYGLNPVLDDNSVIFQGNNNDKLLRFNIDYSSHLDSPNIRIAMYRRQYDTIYDTDYDLVDLADYVDQTLVPTTNSKEYMLINNPNATNTFSIVMNDEMLTGTYRLAFRLYDDETMIGEIIRYIIIK